MTRADLASFLGLPPESSCADLLNAHADRVVGVENQLLEEGLAKPVKIMLIRDLGDLKAASLRNLLTQLEHVGRAEALLADITAELAKPEWTRGVIELLLGKLRPLVPAIADDDERLTFEKRLIEVTEKLKVVEPPPPPLPKPATWGSTPPQHDLQIRIESYFAEVAAERAKALPARGVVRLWLQKISGLLEQLPDEQDQLRHEKRLVEIEYWLEGSQPPWPRSEPALAPKAPPAAPLPDLVVPPPPPPPVLPVTPVPPPPKAQQTPPVPAAAPVSVAPARLAKPIPGTLLQFIPKPAEGTLRGVNPPIHFVARPHFVLGRQRSKSDFVLWFLPTNPVNQPKTDTISRVNTTLVAKGAQLWVHDGEILPDGKSKPSSGTVVDGAPVNTAPVQLNFTKERLFRLGQSGYELKAKQLMPASPDGPWGGDSNLDTASSQATIVLPNRPVGCVRFQCVSCSNVEVNAIWLFSEASLGPDPSCAVALDQADLPPIALRVHHWENGFWLTIPTGGNARIRLDDETLKGGDVRALQSAHQLVVGALSYDLKVSP